MTEATCMSAPWSSMCRKALSSAVRRSGLRGTRGSNLSTRVLATFNSVCKLLCTTSGKSRPVDLSDPHTFSRVYDEHARSVYGAALRILGDPARAQDVAHDVFLRVWRNPTRFDPKRGDVGSYLRLMARSRALDTYRESQAATRARGRLELAVAVGDDGAAEERPS